MFIHENTSAPAAITTQVATVRHSVSVPVNCQIASTAVTTATPTQTVTIQNEHARTMCGFKNPRLGVSEGAWTLLAALLKMRAAG